MPGNVAAATFQTFYNMFSCESSRRRDVNDVIYDAEGHTRADMGARES